MEIAKVAETGQVMIPPEMRKTDRLDVGTEIILTDTVKGILIQPKPPFPPTTLNQVAECLKVQGSPKTLEDMESAISTGIQEQWQDCSWAEYCGLLTQDDEVHYPKNLELCQNPEIFIPDTVIEWYSGFG